MSCFFIQQQIAAPISDGESGHNELDLAGIRKRFGEGRIGILRSTPRTTPASPVTISRGSRDVGNRWSRDAASS